MVSIFKMKKIIQIKKDLKNIKKQSVIKKKKLFYAMVYLI